MDKKRKFLNSSAAKKGSRTTLILAGIAVVLLIVLIVMLLLLPKEEEEIPETVPPTTVATEAPTEPATEPTETEAAETEPEMLAHMAELYDQNSEIVGWLKIDDTKIDYAVMYAPDELDKYIHKNFEGNYSFGGLPYVDEDCSMDPESDNLIIYGHNMNNGTMFNNIMNYANKSYWEKHPTISFTTLYEERTYEVLAAFYDHVYFSYEDVFKFYQFIDAEDEEHFNEAITYYKDNAEYDTGVTAEYGDRLITLVTCSYHVDYGRFVVVAREVTDEAE